MNLMRLKFIIVFALILVCVMCAHAQQTNAPGATDYSDLSRFISERNIFDPSRYSRLNRNARRPTARPVAVPTFALVGTMNYQKGVFAFFDGNNSDYRKILQPGGVIAGYTVAEISPSRVKLQAADKKPVEMNIGAQMRREGDSGWELSGQAGDSFAAAAQSESSPEGVDKSASSESSVPASSSGEASDVLKRLMQQREQEMK